MEGVGLMLFHPDLYFRDCQHCLKYVYDEEGDNAGQLSLFRGEPVERVVPAPCCNRKHPKGCLKGTAENPKVLTPKNQKVYQHWKECKAVGQFPEDDIVKKHAALIQDIVDQANEHKQMQMMSIMMLGKSM